MSQFNLTGQKFGKFTVISALGEGSMGVVYRATDDLERTVALKILPPDKTIDQSHVERFKREAKSAATLHHPNIVTIFEVGQIDGLHYISMQYIDGRTLREVMDAEGAMSVDRVVALLTPVASALDKAHSHNIIHRDIKPSNIMQAKDGTMYLTDFGLARGLDADQTATAAGMILGTPEYMSPEQAKGLSDIGTSTDIYSLGIVAYHMLTGELPFTGETTMLSLLARLQHPPRPLSQFRPDIISSDVDAAVMKALEREPQDRYQRAGELVDALGAASASMGGSIALTGSAMNKTLVVESKSLPPMPAPATEHLDKKPEPAGTRKGPGGMVIGGVVLVLLLIMVGGGAMAMGVFSGSPDDDPTEPTAITVAPQGGAATGSGPDPTEEPTEEEPVLNPEPTEEPASGTGLTLDNQIVFVVGENGDRELFVMNPDGSERDSLADFDGDTNSPAIAPDGSQVAFVSDETIYVMQADGSDIISLTDQAESAPAWSPDGTRLAFVQDDHIYTMNADGSEPTQLTREPGTYNDLAWGPADTGLLAFETNVDIYVIGIDGSNPTNLTDSPDDRDQEPAWSPDGSQLAFASARNGETFDIYVMEATGRNVTRLTEDENIDSSPSWSPDGTQMVFRSGRDRNDEIYRMNADGSEQTNLTNTDIDETAPVWSP